MARTTSDEELQLKKRARRRLVGAVVLATTVAVVLPMVLDNEPKPVSHNVNIQIPSPDAPGFSPKSGASVPREEVSAKGGTATPSDASPVQPERAEADVARTVKPNAPVSDRKDVPATIAQAEAPKIVEPTPAQSAKPAEKDAAEPAKTQTEAQKSVSKDGAKEQGKEAPRATPNGKETQKAAANGKDNAKSAANGKFVVQVAALADSAKAKQLQRQMSGAGVRAYTEVVKTAKGNVTRVRAGPYDTREAAEKARGRLKGAGIDGKVVPR